MPDVENPAEAEAAEAEFAPILPGAVATSPRPPPRAPPSIAAPAELEPEPEPEAPPHPPHRSAAAAAQAAGGPERLGVADIEDVIQRGFVKFANVPPFTLDALLEDHADADEAAAAAAGVNTQQTDVSRSVDRVSAPTDASTEADPNDLMRATKQELEKLQIETVYSLVEKPYVEIEGKMSRKELLFLTNKQANDFDFKRVQNLFNAMEISTPKLVITLSESRAAGNFKAGFHGCDVSFKQRHRNSAVLSHHTHSEVSATALQEMERRLGSFLEECVLPVAVQTQALVLVSLEACIVASTFCDICDDYARTTSNNKLPFTVLALGNAAWLTRSSKIEGSVSNILQSRSQRWQANAKEIHDVMSAAKGDEIFNWDYDELPGGCTHYIIFSGITGGKVNAKPFHNFASQLSQYLSSDLGLPTIAIGAAHLWPGFIADTVARGVPLLILDTDLPSPDGYPNTISDTETQLIERARELFLSGTLDLYHCKRLAQLQMVVTKVHRQTAHDSSIDNSDLPICDVIKAVEEAEVEARDEGNYELEAANAEAPDVIGQAIALYEKMDLLSEYVQRRWSIMVVDRARSSLDLVDDASALDEWLLQRSIDWKHHFTDTEMLATKMWEELGAKFKSEEGRFLIRKRGIMKGKLCFRVLCLHSDVAKKSDVQQEKRAIQGILEEYLKELWYELDEERIAENRASWDPHRQLRRIFKSPKCYAGNLSNLKHLSQIIGQVARIDRLPANNEPQAMYIVRRAWDNVDIYSHHATSSKYIAKLSYAFLLLLSLAIVVVIQVSINRPEKITKDGRARLVTGLSLAGAATAAMSSFFDPGNRWMQLRGAALNLEAEIWRFRARCGPYALSGSNWLQSRAAEQHLLESVESIAQHVAKAASVSDTSFFARFEVFGKAVENSKNLSWYRHGQYPGCRSDGTFGANVGDDHHSPVPVSAYIERRLEPMVRFYQSRLPKYYRTRVITEIILILGSLSGALMAFVQVEEWAAIAAATVASVSAWNAFHATNRKMARYSNTVEKCASIKLWWEQLAPVDKANVARMDDFVMSCEDIFERERDAWLATSKVVKLLSPNSEEADQNEGDELKKE